MRSVRRSRLVATLTAASALALAAIPFACGKSAPRATAERIETRTQLVGGPDALGDLGDFKLSNGKVRFVIQGITERCQPMLGDDGRPTGAPKCAATGFSRGWGVYAGSIVDADLVRPARADGEPNGNDRFGELFPALFLEAIEPVEIAIGNDGSDGRPATIVVTGRGSPFLTLARNLLDLAIKPEDLEITTTYSLGPDDQYVAITTSVVDPSRARKFPADGFSSLGVDIAIPFGHVLLFGNRNSVFLPGAGFDLRWGLEDSYKLPPRLPALNGLVTDLIATKADGVSYGFLAKAPEEPEHNYVWRNRGKIGPDAAPNRMLVPFYASSFTGAFSAQPPDTLPQGEIYSYTNYFIVGNGDVGSVRDVQFQVEKTRTGRFTALVREEQTNAVVPGASVVVLDAQGRPFSQYTPDAQGRVSGRLPKGKYQAAIVCDHRRPPAPVAFDVREGFTTELVLANGSRTLEVPRNALLNVRVTEESANAAENGRPLPAKITLLGEYEWSASRAGKEPREFLYDLKLGERMLSTDGVPDTEGDGATRRYVERVILAGADGRAHGEVKPGRYAVLVSRGPEYDTTRLGDPATGGLVELKPGEVLDLSASLRRVVDTRGWVSADFHVHSANSIDATINLDDRVLTYAAEGVEYIASTDHNVVTDLRPNLQGLGLEDWLNTTVGVEMTTLEMGHFNAFPIRYEPGPATHGAFDWVDLPPRDLFQTLRAMGTTAPDTVVQVNHPRDTILGYFNQFNVSADTGLPRMGNVVASPNGPAFGPDKFSWQFDAMEVFNGKRHELLRTYRMPAVKPPDSPDVPAAPGEIVRLPCPEAKPDCDYASQEIAFPGSVEDWFQLLNLGGTVKSEEETIRPVTATGNSDSHGLYFEEAGYPRNWVKVASDEPRHVTEGELARSVRRHQVVFSNGPFIEVTADGSGFGESRTSPVGGILAPRTDTVKLRIRVSAAPWVDVDHVLVYVNGQEVKRVAAGADRARTVRCCTEDVDVRVTGDAWIVVAAEGDESLFPYVSPLEVPPLAVSDAVSAIAAPLGFGGDDLGGLHPSETGPAVPFAMTNPIWIDRTGPNGQPDGVSFGRGRDAVVVGEGENPLVAPGVRVERNVPPPIPIVPKEKRAPRTSDLGRIFRHWGHSH